MSRGNAAIASHGESFRIETARGLACLLLVSYHVIGYDAAHGLGIASGSGLRIVADFFGHVRMPLFTFLSGFVYAYRPVQPGAAGTFLRKKLRRLLVPLLVVTTLYYLAHRMAFGQHEMAPDRFWMAYLYPYAHLWFLQALVILFAVTAVLEHVGAMRNMRSFLAVLGCVLALQLAFRLDPAPFSVNYALYLAPFFLAGIGANRFRSVFQTRSSRFLAVTAFLLSAGTGLVMSFADSGIPARQTPVATLISMTSCFALLAVVPAIRWMAWVGGYSYAIYLYHLIFTAAALLLAQRAGVESIAVNFVAGLVAGIAGPILIELVVARRPILARLLLGRSGPASGTQSDSASA